MFNWLFDVLGSVSGSLSDYGLSLSDVLYLSLASLLGSKYAWRVLQKGSMVVHAGYRYVHPLPLPPVPPPPPSELAREIIEAIKTTAQPIWHPTTVTGKKTDWPHGVMSLDGCIACYNDGDLSAIMFGEKNSDCLQYLSTAEQKSVDQEARQVIDGIEQEQRRQEEKAALQSIRQKREGTAYALTWKNNKKGG